MRIAVDGHIHLYAGYDLAKAFSCLAANLSNVAVGPRRVPEGPGPACVRVACLAERADCHFADRLRSGEISVPDWAVESAGPALRVSHPAHGRFYLMPGRQIVTAERLEVLALCTSAQFPDGLSVADAVQAVDGAGGVPVLNWAPGKWWFGRGQTVGRLLRESSPDRFFLGDTALRPAVWPLPHLMREGARLGFTRIAGSDPLPLPDEERVLGQYGFVLDGEFADGDPLASASSALRAGRRGLVCRGRRRGPIDVALRLRAHAAARS